MLPKINRQKGEYRYIVVASLRMIRCIGARSRYSYSLLTSVLGVFSFNAAENGHPPSNKLNRPDSTIIRSIKMNQ